MRKLLLSTVAALAAIALHADVELLTEDFEPGSYNVPDGNYINAAHSSFPNAFANTWVSYPNYDVYAVDASSAQETSWFDSAIPHGDSFLQLQSNDGARVDTGHDIPSDSAHNYKITVKVASRKDNGAGGNGIKIQFYSYDGSSFLLLKTETFDWGNDEDDGEWYTKVSTLNLASGHGLAGESLYMAVKGHDSSGTSEQMAIAWAEARKI